MLLSQSQTQLHATDSDFLWYMFWACIRVQVTIYRRLQIGRDVNLDQSEVYDISNLCENTGSLIK